MRSTPLEAGRLNRRLRIEEPVRVQASDGSLATTWRTVAERVPCAVEPLSVNAFVAAQSLKSSISVRILMRYRPGLNASMRFVADDGTVYKPQGFLPDPVSGREYLTCPCSSTSPC